MSPREIDVTTADELRAALTDIPGDTPVLDMMGEAVLVTLCSDPDTGEQLLIVS